MYISIILTIGEYKMNVTIFVSDKQKKLIDEIKKDAKRQGVGLGKYLLSLYQKNVKQGIKDEQKNHK